MRRPPILLRLVAAAALAAAGELPAAAASMSFQAPAARDAASPAPTIIQDCASCPRMVVLEDGAGPIGSPLGEPGRYPNEAPQRAVAVARLSIGASEVTRKQYGEFIASSGYAPEGGCFTPGDLDDWASDLDPKASWREPGFDQDDEHPVVCVSWFDARAYADWLSARTGQRYRLPTEVEWEHAARGGAASAYFWGADIADGCSFMNGGDASLAKGLPRFAAKTLEYFQSGVSKSVLVPCDDGHVFTSAAGSYPANAYGLVDVTGNAWEWVEDCGDDPPAKTAAQSTAGECRRRGTRGGSWNDWPVDLRSAVRKRLEPSSRRNDTGFRLVRETGPAVPPAPAATPTAGSSFRECADCPEMLVLPAGTFRMGSREDEPGRAADEGPAREVTIGSPFAIARYELTRGQYEAFLRSTNHPVGGDCITDRRKPFDWKPDAETTLRDPGYPQTDRHPVVCVSWHDAQAFVAWLNARTGGGYRLPSEAEWEYAARAGSRTAYFWGDDVDEGCAFMNGTDETARDKYPAIEFMKCRDGALNTLPVGSYRANAFGLFDMTGNVAEWIAGCATPDYSKLAPDGRDQAGDCARRMVRGGSWGTIPRQQRSAERIRYAPGDRDDSIGIRLVRSLDRPLRGSPGHR